MHLVIEDEDLAAVGERSGAQHATVSLVRDRELLGARRHVPEHGGRLASEDHGLAVVAEGEGAEVGVVVVAAPRTLGDEGLLVLGDVPEAHRVVGAGRERRGV